MADPASMHVTDIQQHQETEYSADHGMHDVMKVHFTTPSGTRTHVKVPMTHYSVQNVAAAIHHHARQVEGVHHLENTGVTPTGQ